ncbi:MAG TPA: pH regulation protein F [Wenzhouxiangellaceae bacterium]|nr:pH regulation protein F [Wenzhouxiangellaceae bacterium]
MTASVLPWAIVFLLLNLGAGLWRAWKGPTDGDRLLTTLLFATTSVALLLLMSEWLGMPAIRTVALMLVLLATIISLAFFGMPERPPQAGEDKSAEVADD